MVKEKSSNTAMAVVVTLLSVIIVGLVGFIIYDKVINKTSEPDVEEKNNGETSDADYNLKDAKKLVDKYFVFYGNSTSFDKMSNSDKNAIAYTQLNDNELKSGSCKSLYGTNFYTLGETVLVCDSKTIVVDYETLNNKYHELFGENQNAEKESFYNHKKEYINYVSNTDQYAKLDCEGTCGSEFEILYVYDVLSAKIDKDSNLTIKVGYDSFFFDTDEEAYVSTYNNSNKVNSASDLNDNYVNQNLNNIYELTLTFKKDNNNFILKNFTVK